MPPHPPLREGGGVAFRPQLHPKIRLAPGESLHIPIHGISGEDSHPRGHGSAPCAHMRRLGQQQPVVAGELHGMSQQHNAGFGALRHLLQQGAYAAGSALENLLNAGQFQRGQQRRGPGLSRHTGADNRQLFHAGKE